METQETITGELKYKNVGKSIAGTKSNTRIQSYYNKLIGHFRGERRPEILSFRENAREVQGISKEEIKNINCFDSWQMNQNTYEKDTIIRSLKSSSGSGNMPKIIDKTFKAHRSKELREHKGSPTLTSSMGTGGNNVPMVIGYTNKTGEHQSGQVFNIKGIAPTLNKCHYKSPPSIVSNCVSPCFGRSGSSSEECEMIRRVVTAQALRNLNRNGPTTSKEHFFTAQQSQGCENGVWRDKKLRRLTPTECERLQGFPRDWTKFGIDDKGEKVKISDTQRYKMMGNAVTTNVVRAIIERLTQ